MQKTKINYWDKKFIKKILIIAVPLIISSIIASLIRISDNTMVGLFQNKDSGELAATSLAGKYFSIASTIVVAYLATTRFLINQYIGKKDKEKVSEVLKLQFIGGAILTFIAIIVAYTCANQIMEFFQGSNFKGKGSKSYSTDHGVAQEYLKYTIWILIPWFLLSIGYLLLVSFGKQKIIIPLSIINLGLNILLNWLFYKVFDAGLKGIAFSTIICNIVSLTTVYLILYMHDESRHYIFNSLLSFWHFDKGVAKISLKKWAMAMQTLIFKLVLIGTTIIYSRWYGDNANGTLAIVMPVSTLFYSALEGIASSKGIFVGKKIGSGETQEAFANDKKINLYTFVTALAEGILLMLAALIVPLVWNSSSSYIIHNAQLCMIAIGATYPFAALTATLTGSFKVAGKGKTIILSNTSVAVILEFGIPLIMFIIYSNAGYLSNFEFWELYLIARCVKLLKFPLTYIYWKKKKWLERII